jgi:hypothetical protein
MQERNCKNTLRIDWATHQATKYACEKWHYSKSVPVPPLVKVGVWEDEKFIGVLVFSRGASASLFKPYGLKQDQGCELTRVALTKHKTPVSRIMSIAMKFLKKTNPNLELIVSFADPSEGHHGGIYQATNWIYAGQSAPSYEYIDKFGRKWHSRQVSEKGWNIQQGQKRKTVKPSECAKVFKEGKHRYLMPLKNKEKYQKFNLGYYPKRHEHESNASDFQSGEGGAIPTMALQYKGESDV